MRILVVEDDPSISVPLAEGLAREGFEVDVAATGAAALAAEPVDLVLLDLGLPDLEGSVVCQRLRAASAVPIIVVTARGEEIDRVMLLELGADDYVVKPFGIPRARRPDPGGAAPDLGRRHGRPVATEIVVGPLRIDRRARLVQFDGPPGRADPEGVRPAAVPRRGAGCGARPRAADPRGVGRALVGVDQDARRARRVAAQEAAPGADRDRAVGRATASSTCRRATP